MVGSPPILPKRQAVDGRSSSNNTENFPDISCLLCHAPVLGCHVCTQHIHPKGSAQKNETHAMHVHQPLC